MESSFHFATGRGVAASRMQSRRAPSSGRALVLWLAALCGVFVSAVTAQIDAPPRLLSISGASTVDQGERVTLAVIFLGNPPTTPLRYQWAKNGTAIAGATASSHVIAEATAADAGIYAITVTNNTGASTISGEVTVRPPSVIQFSSVTVDPGLAVAAGSGFSFRVNAIGSFPRTYQWQKDGVDIPGATNLTLNIGPVTVAHGGSYRVIGRNSLGTSSSTPVTVTVSPATSIVFAPNSPADVTFVEGQGGQLTFTLSEGSHPMTYQWRKNGVLIANGPDSYLSLGSVTLADAGRYSVTATNAAGSVTSREAVVTVVPATPIIISRHPAPQTVFVGQEARFSVEFSSGTQPIRYQWRKDGVALPGETGTVLAFARTSEADAADYSVVLTNPAGSITSNAARLTVQAATAPVILRQPVDVNVAYYAQFQISAKVAGTAPLTYQWRRNGQLIPTYGPEISGEAVPQEQGAIYVLEVTNAAGTATTTPATVTVQPPVLPIISREPQPVTVALGGEASLVVQYSTVGAGPVTLQWLKNGQPIGEPGTGGGIPSAPHTATYYFRVVQPADAGEYSVRLTGAAGTVMTSSARLTVQDGPGSGQDYSGVYFGSLRRPFSSDLLDVALYIRPDRSGVLLSQGNNMPSGVGTFVLSASGSFRFQINNFPADPGSGAIVTGSISSEAVVSGSIEGQGITFSATKVAGDSPLAGFYRAPAAGVFSGEMLAIVGGNGQLVALAQTSQIRVAAAGVPDAAGKIAATNPNNHTLDLSVNALVGELSATATAPRSSPASFLAVREGIVRAARLANISTRGRAGAGEDAMIAGFVVSGSGARRVLVRAIGPALASFGVNGSLADARLTLFRGTTAIMESDDWGTEGNASDIKATASRVGAFGLAESGRDAVLLMALEPGNYTAQVTGKNGAPGVALVEVYDAGQGSEAAAPRLLNIATRGWVGGGDDALIAGIVVTGNAPKTVLIRAIGPGLARLGVSGTLADPMLSVQQSEKVIAANDDWNRIDGSNDVIAVLSATTKVGAFALANESLDAALVARLYPGNHTARVSGKNGATGVALIEVYEIDP